MDSPPTDPRIAAWLDSQRTEGTKRSYADAARQWLAWLGPVDLWDATARDADLWRGHLLNDPPKRQHRTVGRLLASIASLYAHMERSPDTPEEWMSPFLRIKRPAVNNRQGETPDLLRGEAAAFMDAAKAAGPRTHVAAALLLGTAIRADELLTLRVEKIRTSGGTLVISLKRKGGKNDELPLPERVADDVDVLRGDRTKGFLLANMDGTGAWTYPALHRAIVAAGKAARLTVTPHVLRVTWATLALEDGVGLETVQDVMGHASADTTRRYDRGRDAMHRKKAAVERVDAVLRGESS